MANLCDTQYKVTGSPKAVKDLWQTLQKLEVNKNDVALCLLAEHYNIDCENSNISLRGHIYWAELEENESDGHCLLSFDTETAWSACDGLFEEVNKTLGGELSISYREIECGFGIYYVHDEGDFFPEQCYVNADGDLFGNISESFYCTITDAIDDWCSIMGIVRQGRTDEQMVDFINKYEYDTEDTYFTINLFTFI